MENKLNEINKLRSQLFAEEVVTDEMLVSRKNRLKKLIDDHGYESVSAASGLSTPSLITYLRTKHPRLSETTLTQAEEILAQL